MKPRLILLALCLSTSQLLHAQTDKAFNLATKFVSGLTEDQKAKALYAFESDERYNWHFVPLQNRIGVKFNELSQAQRDLALELLRAYIGDKTYQKTLDIMKMELLLHELEKREPGSWNRDPGRYSLTFFGTPAPGHAWGWRFEGHHVSFSFSSINNKVIASTPSFMGANPSIVLAGPEKGKQIFKDEAQLGFALLHKFSPEQAAKAVYTTTAPGDIITMTNRTALITPSAGIPYAELNKEQKALFMQLMSLYINRFSPRFADDMMHEIEMAGVDKLLFAWAGATVEELGKGHYYRIQGPTVLIEYDNTQNEANHVHTVVRDLKHDYGGDELLAHYKKFHY
ncbi:DUF3500 domain-containing protein [Hufsiella ginkgonis]|uniref:DUF3500 domain-containing protein n=1 Tax=Hufsiella ginkgonis TaxID=2695274 RepID=A0A7K1XY84_9SPHI|nr:DUF3500 domain-containing protein [Hufsiella ginkgonis]MXV15964.1 DUF3500 domain-containing protein [Hufsiella ginkgonis]